MDLRQIRTTSEKTYGCPGKSKASNKNIGDKQLTLPCSMDQYFRETGAKVVSMSKPQRERMKISQEEAVLHKIAKLVVPLQFPKERVIPRKP